MLKLAIKFLLRTKLSDDTSEKTRLLILEKIKHRDIWIKHRSFFADLVDYYERKKIFTQVQLKAVKGL